MEEDILTNLLLWLFKLCKFDFRQIRLAKSGLNIKLLRFDFQNRCMTITFRPNKKGWENEQQKIVIIVGKILRFINFKDPQKAS